MNHKEKTSVEQLQKALLDAEKSGQYSYEELIPIWEQAKEAIGDEGQMVSLYTTFIYLTRRFAEREQSTLDYSNVEELFSEGSNFLEECFEGYSDASIRFEKNFAYFLYTKLKKIEQAREIWNKLLEEEQSAYPWLEAISLERAYGDAEYARRLFFKALDAVAYRQEEIFGRFVQFEREEGTREQLDLALARVNAKATEYNARMKQQQYNKPQQKPMRQRRESDGQKTNAATKREGVKDKKGKNTAKGKETNGQRRTEGQKDNSDQQKGKTEREVNGKPRPSEGAMDVDREGNQNDKGTNNKNNSEDTPATFETSAIPMGPFIPGIAPLTDDNKKEDEIAENQQDHKDMIPESSKKMVGEKRKRPSNSPERALFPYNTGLEKNKLFVKKLDWSCTCEELKKFFGKFGAVVDARIVTKWNGRSKGCAYVEFADEQSTSAALMGSDGAEIRGRKIEVYLSNPPPTKKSKTETTSKQKILTTDEHRLLQAFCRRRNADEHPRATLSDESRQKRQNTKTASFVPRAAFFTSGGQRTGRASRLMLTESISKRNQNTGMSEKSESPVGVVTESTKEMTLQQQGET